MKNQSLLFIFCFCCISFFACQSEKTPTSQDSSIYVSGDDPGKYIKAPYAEIKINGKADDPVWKAGKWYPLNQNWLGLPYDAKDFTGRYQVAWSENYLYVIAQIKDDQFVDTHADGLSKYWDDDCLEIFVDEDKSGGNHQYSYNAFAYHIAKDKRVVDIAPDSTAKYYNDHVTTVFTYKNDNYTWECAVSIYNDQYDDSTDKNSPLRLEAGKKLGFALAYCDNDFSEERENFIGSVEVPGEDKNRGWIDASIFGTVELVK